MHGPTTPPTSTEFEKALIGSAIIDPSQLDAVADAVTGEDFTDADLGKLFDSLLILQQAGEPIGDTVIIAKRLEQMRVPLEVRNLAALAEFARFTPTAHHAAFYAAEIHKAALLRGIRQTGLAVAQRASEAGATPEDLTAWADAKLQALGVRQPAPVKRIDAIAGDVLAELDKPTEHGRPLMTGLFSVDQATGGFCPGELIVLAARPGVGKSAFAMQVALHNAIADRAALFASLEMSEADLMKRILCGHSGVDSRLLRSGTIGPESRKRLKHAAEQIADTPLFVFAPPSSTLSKIRAVARQHKASGNLSLLVVDYLQLIRPDADQRKLQRYEQVTAVSSGLKILARELRVPVLCLAQLNREAEKEVPRLSHLRESGAIEQDADIVLFLCPEKEATGQTPGEVFLKVAKHRHGDTGDIDLAWLPGKTQFEDPDIVKSF